MESWKDVPGYEGRYQVSDHGNVRSLLHFEMRVLKKCTVSGGYDAVSLGRNNSRAIHRLVAAAFLGAQDERLVLHGDGNRKNNILANLRYGSHIDNAADAAAHGTQVRGERQHAAKLTADIVRFMRESGRGAYDLAKEFNVTPQCVSLVLKRKNWAHI